MAQDAMHPLVQIVRKEIIATGGRGCWTAIRGYTRNKFECLCQIFSVYSSNTAFFSLIAVMYVILHQFSY